MKTELLAIFACVSAALVISALVYSLRLYRNGKRATRLLSSVQIYTIGVFAAVVLLFIPIYYTSYDFGNSFRAVRTFLIAIHNAMRIFILDGDFDIIMNAVKGESTLLRVSFSVYAALLYVIAPVLTFGNVLSMFKNIKGELKYRWHRYRKHYIMSELNVKSIALAKSIYEKEKNAVIVFTDVFEQNTEADYELLLQARDINAICMKKDITNLDIVSKKGDVELFMIGSDESENVSQAVKIATELNQKNKKYNVKLFVFSTKAGAAYIIDSIRCDNLLAHASDNDYASECFKLRRVDEKQQLIWNTIPKMKLFDMAQRHDNTICVMLAGLGNYGMEFFKTLLWYCQIEGYKLQITAFDKRTEGENDRNFAKQLLNRQCPELLEKNRCELEGEAYYDVEIFSGIDFMRDDFEKMLHYRGDDAEKRRIAERLKKTNLAIVSLGDDDVNIEMAIYLRSVFDRINGVKAHDQMRWEDEVVDIYSVVYDDQKSKILCDENENGGNLLRNHKDVPYHIHFIGGMSSQFDYRNIYDEELERSAYLHHVGWVDVEEKLHDELKKKGEAAKYKWCYKDIDKREFIKAERKKYEQYEYYRRSSVARELYQREIRNNPKLLEMTTCLQDGAQSCTCANCVRRKRSEHMRWNAYTRVLGYTYSPKHKADRALQHDNLCEWSKLDELERYKD